MKKVVEKWQFVYSEGHSMTMNEAWLRAFTDYPKVPGIFNTILFENVKTLQTCYTTEEELQRVREQGKIFFDKQYSEKFKREIKQVAEDFTSYYKNFKTLEVSSLSNEQLWNLFKGYIDRLAILLAYFQVSGGRCFPILEESVKRSLGNYFQGEELASNYGLLLASTEFETLELEEAALLKLAEKASVSDSDLKAQAETFALHYFNSYNEDKILNFLRKRIEKAKREGVSGEEFLRKIEAEKKELIAKQSHIESKVREKDVLELASFLREQGHLRFVYKDVWSGAEYRFLAMFKELARRVGVSVEDFLASYRTKEIKRFLETGQKISPAEIEKRKNSFVLYQDENGQKIFAAGEEAKKLARAVLGNEDAEVTELKGVPASAGLARGRARVVLCRGITELEEDLTKFQKGEVLVTTMTQPNMIFLMKKACAIVTNQGGMTSHAAVISRELKIPCIVGTMKATKVFKDGDLLEVDASRGIVRKIE